MKRQKVQQLLPSKITKQLPHLKFSRLSQVVLVIFLVQNLYDRAQFWVYGSAIPYASAQGTILQCSDLRILRKEIKKKNCFFTCGTQVSKQVVNLSCYYLKDVTTLLPRCVLCTCSTASTILSLSTTYSLPSIREQTILLHKPLKICLK